MGDDYAGGREYKIKNKIPKCSKWDDKLFKYNKETIRNWLGTRWNSENKIEISPESPIGRWKHLCVEVQIKEQM